MADVRESDLILAKNRLDDASARLRYQHEFSVEGLKALVLINGGAIIALLTYAGHGKDKGFGDNLMLAVTCYAAGLVFAMLAYVVAYLSQANLMNSDVIEAYRLLGLEHDGDDKPRGAKEEKVGMIAIRAGILLTTFSIGGFVAGSSYAAAALS